jgi:FKBP-type peptidyl-prolyl cis-trans isomerase
MHNTISLYLITLLSFFTLFIGCNNNSGPEFEDPDFSTVPPPYDTTGVEAVNIGDGILTYTIEEGTGSFTVVNRDQVSIFFTLRRTNGDIVNSTYANGRTLPQIVVVGSLSIDGLRRGLIGMRTKEKRTLVVPPEFGYGDVSENNPNYFLRNDTLIYDVYLFSILD